MPKKFVFALISLFTVLSFCRVATAADFSLAYIGAMATGGAVYDEWWYTGSNPTFVGTAGEGATVMYDIDGDTGSFVADSDGNWSYNAGLSGGDVWVSFSSEGESVGFTLHLGQDVPGSTESTGSVPDTGSYQALLVSISVSAVAAGVYLWINSPKDKKSSFEKNIVDFVDD
jgi:hypothetical protein